MINYTFLENPYHGKFKFAKYLKMQLSASFCSGISKSYKKSKSKDWNKVKIKIESGNGKIKHLGSMSWRTQSLGLKAVSFSLK